MVLWDLNREALEETVHDLPTTRIHTDVVDVRDPVAVATAAGRAREAAGPIAHVVNSAGILRVGSAEQVTPADYRLMMEVNYLGSVHVTQALLPFLREAAARTPGCDATLLLIASVAGLRGFPQLAGYCASKFAVLGFVEALRDELRNDAIDVRALCPPPGDTPMVSDLPKRPPIYRLSKLFSADEVVDATLRTLDEGRGDWRILIDASSRLTWRVNRLAPKVVDVITRAADS